MSKELKNIAMDIIVLREVVLGGKHFYPHDNLVAQLLNADQSEWNICYSLGNPETKVKFSELEQFKDAGSISYDATEFY